MDAISALQCCARCYWLFSTVARMKRVSITAVNSDGDQVAGMNGATADSGSGLSTHTHNHTHTEDINVCMNACMQRHLQMLTLKNKSQFKSSFSAKGFRCHSLIFADLFFFSFSFLFFCFFDLTLSE